MPESPQVEEWGFCVFVVKYSMDLENAIRIQTLEKVKSWILDCSSDNCPGWYECEKGNALKESLRETIDYRIKLIKEGGKIGAYDFTI